MSSAPQPEFNWKPTEGRLKGYVCEHAGSQWGMIVASRNHQYGAGWSSSYGGFFTELEDAKAAHVEAVLRNLELRNKAMQEPSFTRHVAPLTIKERCQAVGKTYVNYQALQAKRLDEENARRRSGPRMG